MLSCSSHADLQQATSQLLLLLRARSMLHVEADLHAILEISSSNIPVMVCHAVGLVLGQSDLNVQQLAAQRIVAAHQLTPVLLALQPYTHALDFSWVTWASDLLPSWWY